MAMPPFAPFPAPYPFPAALGTGIYPGGGATGRGNVSGPSGSNNHHRGGHHGGHHMSSGGGGRSGAPGLNGAWQWNNGNGGTVNGGWEGNWHHQRGPAAPWMAAAGAEVWGHPRNVNGFGWGGGNGVHTAGNGTSGSGRGRNNKR